jgi:hypothetical protein
MRLSSAASTNIKRQRMGGPAVPEPFRRWLTACAPSRCARQKARRAAGVDGSQAGRSRARRLQGDTHNAKVAGRP